MREVIFRGKRTDNGEWVEGYYAVSGTESGTPNQSMILSNGGVMSYAGLLFHNVHPETVGQFTGLLDKNGKKIFEGDAVSWNNSIQKGVSKILFYDGGFRLADYPFSDHTLLETGHRVEVIGNIHDNPELINQ